MSLFNTLAHKGAYYVLHPLLKAARRVVPPSESARLILLYGDTEILLVRHIGVSRWSLPGGKLHRGEAPAEGALRELKEELQLNDIALEYKLGTYHSYREGAHGPVHVYVAHSATLYRRKQWEIDEARWFLFSDLPPNLSPATARRIGEYKNGLKEVSDVW